MKSRAKIALLPIGSKVVRSTMLAAGAALCLAGILMVVFQFIASRSTLLRDLQVQARIVGNNSTAALLFSDARAAEEILHGLSASPSVQSANIILGSTPLAQFRRNGAPVPELPVSEGGESLHEYGMDYIEVQEPITVDHKLIGSVSIRATLLPLYRRSLAFARISHFGMPRETSEIRLVRSEDSLTWVAEDGTPIDTHELRRHFELLVS